MLTKRFWRTSYKAFQFEEVIFCYANNISSLNSIHKCASFCVPLIGDRLLITEFFVPWIFCLATVSCMRSSPAYSASLIALFR